MSSSTTASGRLLTAAPRATKVGRRSGPHVDAEFAAEWNELEKDRRRQVRRLVRIGQPQESREDARLAAGFATFQRSRPWYRFFWLWIVPLTIAGLVAGVGLHPIVIGIVLGAVASAFMVRRNFTRVEKVNRDLLQSGTA